jgi:hypothetical protein
MDRHSLPSSLSSSLSASLSTSVSNAMLDGRCELGRQCYVDTLYLTIGVCGLAVGLSVWAGWKDWRRVVKEREGGERGVVR